MVRGQVNPIISIMVVNNNNNNNNDNNIPLNGFLTFLKWGWRKVFTSAAALRLQDLYRKVQLLSLTV